METKDTIPPDISEDLSEEEQSQRRRQMLRGFLISAVIDGFGSYAVYLLARPHTTELAAIGWSMLPPGLNNIWSLIRKRHLDFVGVIVILGLLAGLALFLLGGSPRLLLVRDSLITGTIGLVFLISLFFPRPLLFYVSRQLTAGYDPELAATWDERYQASPTHLGLPLITGVWGAVLLCEALLRTYLALNLPVAVFLAVSPIVNLAMYAGTSLWSFWYGSRIRDQED
jgi:hypothetical protein